MTPTAGHGATPMRTDLYLDRKLGSVSKSTTSQFGDTAVALLKQFAGMYPLRSTE